MTFRKTLWRASRVKLLGFGLFAAFAVPFTMSPIDNPGIVPPSDVMDERPNAEGSPADLVEKHDCWTGAAPADMEGVIPGHVVMTLKNGKTVYRGSLGVEAALQHVFDEPLPGILEVHAFCR